MKQIKTGKKFKKDYLKIKKQGKNLKKFKFVVDSLCEGEELDKKYKLHKLNGNYNDTLECHIEPDWLLIFQISDEHIELIRMGSHSDLF
ncbi:MAG: type II toxin-antitoxin system YafQ family toxin [Candidatus Gastranaerophilales bacterium]|nr:type II toxin-antitoxin system YafQ family toxin [Candidatus Gastranaerophilales bacterium]